MVRNKLQNNKGSNGKKSSDKGIRRALPLALLVIIVLQQGCFLDRLITLRGQTCSFDKHFTIRLERNIAIEFHDPVLLEKDMDLIWGTPPTSITRSETGSTMHYRFQRVPGNTGSDAVPLLEEFSLDFDYIPVDGQLRLSRISSNDLPGELLSAAINMSLSGMDEITEFACQADLNPFTRSMILPLDRSWFNDIPARDELISLVGTPDSTLEEGKELVYKYRLKGNDAETHIARFVIGYDESGEKPLSVEAGFNSYQMYTDLLTAQMEVRVKI